MRRTTAAALVCVVLTGLGGCSSRTEQYCAALEDRQQALRELADGAGAGDRDFLGESIAIFEDLRDGAPEDVVDEWDTVIVALQGLDRSLRDAGLTSAEFTPGQRPEGVTEAQMNAIEGAAEDLRATDVAEAGNGIEQHAQDVCKVDLSVS